MWYGGVRENRQKGKYRWMVRQEIGDDIGSTRKVEVGSWSVFKLGLFFLTHHKFGEAGGEGHLHPPVNENNDLYSLIFRRWSMVIHHVSYGENLFLECITVNGPCMFNEGNMPALNLVSRLLVDGPLFEMCITISGFGHQLVATTQGVFVCTSTHLC